MPKCASPTKPVTRFTFVDPSRSLRRLEFPDSFLMAISCCELSVQVLVVDL